MIFIERFLILILGCMFLGTSILIAYTILKKSKAKQEAQEQLAHALVRSYKKELENLLIIYDKVFDEDTKEKIRIRIDDIIIEEDAELNYKSKDSL